MAAWTSDELNQIGKAEELQIASLRRDGTLRKPTTIWERWDGQKPDGSFQDKGMNSFNHYAYGAIGDWMYRVMAGIEIDEAAPGYKRVLIQPQPGGGFTNVKASHETMYGTVSSAWTMNGDAFELDPQVVGERQSGNSCARFQLPLQ